jgi:hypothetical protein
MANEPKVCDHHFAFDDDSENKMLEWIQSQAEKSEPVTRTNLRHYCKPNIPVPFLDDGLILSFYAIEIVYLKRKVPHKKTRDQKCHVLFEMKR